MPLKDVKRPGRLTRLGIIRLGVQVPNKRGNGTHPEPTDHFVLTDAPDLIDVFGEEPRELPIHFWYADFDKNIEAYYRNWAGGICVCQGDGETVQSALPFRTTRDKGGKIHVYRKAGDRLVDNGVALHDFGWNGTEFQSGDTVECPGSAAPLYPHCELCGPSILLKIAIRDPRCARYGYYQIGTRSLRNYTHFVEVWDSLTDAGRNPISMNAVHFVLRIAPSKTMYQDDKKNWQTTEKFFLQLELDRRVMFALEQGRERRLMAQLAGPEIAVPEQLPSTVVQSVPEPQDEDEPAPPPWAEDEPEPAQDATFEDAMSEPKPETEPEPAPHWIEDSNVRRRFWAWARGLTLTHEQVHEALSVESVKDFHGTMNDAKAKIEEFVKAKAETE